MAIKHLMFCFVFMLSINASAAPTPADSTGTLPADLETAQLANATTPLPDTLFLEEGKITVIRDGQSRSFPGWLALLPPLLAIGLALLIKEVHIALFCGLFLGAFLLAGFQFNALFEALLRIADTYFIEALIQPGHASIILFSVWIGGMVQIIRKNGGMDAIVTALSKLATNAKRAQAATWALGCSLFFDDYANTLVVGNTMRPLTDRFGVSREKLAYLVDSTAAPIASIGLISTWIGYQVSEIDRGLHASAALTDAPAAYSVFLQSLPYAFYPLLTLVFVFLVAFTGRDFGPMLQAERRARKQEHKQTEEKKDGSKKVYLALIPILCLIVGVFIGLLYSGYIPRVEEQSAFGHLQAILNQADSYQALLWASLGSCIVAVLLTVLSRERSLEQATEDMIKGFQSMIPAVVILVLAWSLASIIDHLHTAEIISSFLPSDVNIRWFPAIVFPLAAAVAFATGSSWGTMAILYPIVLTLLIQLGWSDGQPLNDTSWAVLFNTVSVVLAGAVWGDHCSPISDTTIMSSMASQCKHIEHVRTQMPYAMAVGGISWLFGGLFFGLGLSVWILWPFALLSVFAVVRYIGKPVTA